MSRLLRTTMANAVAFGLNTVLALVIIPFLVAAFGLGGYGLVVLARNFTPAGLAGLLDFGITGAVTRHVAAALATDNRPSAAAYVGVATAVVFCSGLVAAIFLVLWSSWITVSLLPAQEGREAFDWVTRISALALPLQLAAGILQAGLEGQRRFGIVRVAEVGANVLYALLALTAVYQGWGWETVALAYLLASLAKACGFLGVYLLGWRGCLRLSTSGFSRVETKELIWFGWALLQGKMISTLYVNGPAIAIAAYNGASGVGLFDVVMRVPRVAKMMIGLFNNALLPHSARSEALGDLAAVKRIVETGTTLVMWAVTPMVFVVMLFARPLVIQWLGPEQASIAIWISVAMIWPAMLSTVGIGATMVAVRRHAVVALNRLGLVNLMLFLGISFLLTRLGWVGGEGYVLGLVVSSLVIVPLQQSAIMREYGFGCYRHWRFLGVATVLGFALTLVEMGMSTRSLIEGWLSLTAVMVVWAAVYLLLLYFVALSGEEREIVASRWRVLLRLA